MLMHISTSKTVPQNKQNKKYRRIQDYLSLQIQNLDQYEHEQFILKKKWYLSQCSNRVIKTTATKTGFPLHNAGIRF